jgi:hypothetical protein
MLVELGNEERRGCPEEVLEVLVDEELIADVVADVIADDDDVISAACKYTKYAPRFRALTVRRYRHQVALDSVAACCCCCWAFAF